MGKSKQKIKWEEGVFDYLISILQESESVTEACNKFFEKYPKCASRQIRKAFKLHGYSPPSSYLKEAKFDPDKYSTKKVEQKKEQLIRSAEARELQKYRTREAMTDIIVERLSGEIYRMPKPRLPRISLPKTKKPKKSIDIMAIVSDCQIGETVCMKDVGGLNEYNFKIFQIELEKWTKEVIDFITKQSKHYNVDKLIMPFLGDIVEGHDIFSGQAYHLEMDACKQTIEGARAFSSSIAKIATSFPNIELDIIGVPGNHGRVGKRGEAPHMCNWDVVCYRFIEYELENFKKENGGNIVFQWSDAWFQLFQSKGWVFCFLHGDDIRSWMGLPFYGIERAKARYMEMINFYFTYFVIGHFHKEANIPSDNGEKIINGNWVGGNSGSKLWMGSNNPNQWIFTITEKYGISIREKIYLKTRRETKPKVKIYE